MSPKERAHANKYAYNFKCTLMHNTLLNEKRTEAKQTDPMFNAIMETLFAAGRAGSSARVSSTFQESLQ